MGFANELVFNFAGKNPQQPTVLSALPISFVQPLLRGGGRAVILEPLTNAGAATSSTQVRAFAQFRQQFFVVTLTGGTIQNFGTGLQPRRASPRAGNTDPTIGFIPAAFNVVEVEIDRRNVAFYENLVKLYQELIQGEASGLSQLQVDQVMSQLIGARQTPVHRQDHLPHRARPVQDADGHAARHPDRRGPELPGHAVLRGLRCRGRLAAAARSEPRRTARDHRQDPRSSRISTSTADRSWASTATIGRTAQDEFVPEDEDGLEDLLQAAVRIALEYRLDLMNDRAQLYDAWRQIRVTANALKGVLNVALTNNVYTGPYTTNPFAFLSQAKNFSLVLNAELPLVRMTERNNFRTALINYQRARRSLMNAEDNLKIQLRNDLRNVHLAYINYEINKRNYELNVRLKDQAFEQIVAPPAGGTQSLAQSANAATQTTNLLNFQGSGVSARRLGLINGCETYQTNRLIFYRDIGTLPYDEWEAFSELFPSQYHGPIIGHAPTAGRDLPRSRSPAAAGFRPVR